MADFSKESINIVKETRAATCFIFCNFFFTEKYVTSFYLFGHELLHEGLYRKIYSRSDLRDESERKKQGGRKERERGRWKVSLAADELWLSWIPTLLFLLNYQIIKWMNGGKEVNIRFSCTGVRCILMGSNGFDLCRGFIVKEKVNWTWLGICFIFIILSRYFNPAHYFFH